jgi:phosphoribosylamine--glycine ligase
MAAEGYPGSPRRGDRISGLSEAQSMAGVTVLHAGTSLDAGQVVTAGGRVLGVTGVGPTLIEARHRAYTGVGSISWPGAHYRTDIALAATEPATQARPATPATVAAP